LIWFCTSSSSPTLPACASSARSWVIAAWSEATRLLTSATCCVTSCACSDSDSWVPSPEADKVARVCAYTAAGILNTTVAVAWLGLPSPLDAFSEEM
jgi:hypothetical protein